MILTHCAVCATELGLSLGKKCGRCSTRYCGPECQVQHWKEGGHDKLCKSIKKAGGAEQYNANKRYTEALAVAVEACADDTKGQTCYICTQALHWKTKEGLVRGCACRGTAGFAHVSCLAEQAKILIAEVEENNLGDDAFNARWVRWHVCSICEQHHHSVVLCALGWACWKTYAGRPEENFSRIDAMTELGNALETVRNHTDALTVKMAQLSMLRRVGASEDSILIALGNLANSYQKLGRRTEALNMYRDVYSGWLEFGGEEDRSTLIAAINYANCLISLEHFKEAKALMRKAMPVAQRVLGESQVTTLKMRLVYAKALYYDPGATLDNLREAVTTLEETEQTARRVLGGAHPVTGRIEDDLQKARAARDAREDLETFSGDVNAIREAMAAMTPGDA
jgi:tetratricopeptide (TPR) repeat protein